MNKELIQDVDACYELAEQRAAHYFKLLYEQVMQKTYVHTLTKDIQLWKHNHINHNILLYFFSHGKGKSSPKGYRNYIQWLNYAGKLDDYLDRSISYIFMRDLGKALDSPDTQVDRKSVV